MTFMSADKLGIPETHRDALIKTLVHLESGCSEFNPNVNKLTGLYASATKQSFQNKMYFNMARWKITLKEIETGHVCGTACCIGGTAEMLSDVIFFDVTPGLSELFYPKMIHEEKWQDITIEQGSQALRNYLETGNPKWTEVMESGV